MTLIKGIITISNINKICRICLEEKSVILPLPSKIEIKEINNFISISEMLIKLTNTTKTELENDTFPTLICYECMRELTSSYILLLKYEEAILICKDYLSKQIKDEADTSRTEKNTTYTNEDEEEDEDEDEIETKFITHYGTRNAVKQQTNIKQRKKPGRKKKLVVEDEKYELNSFKDDKPILHACPICTKEFTALDLRKHAQTHKALKKYLNIPKDSKINSTTKFYATRQLDKPIVSLFNRTEKLHKCPYCNVEFTVNDFRLHIDEHRKQDEFKCDKCERVFKKLNHLNTHRVKHLKEFPYKCEQCGKGFVIQTNYDCHILTHKNDELPHECKYCLKRFSNPEHLNRHQIIHTENVTYSVKYKVCRCHHCLKTFRDKDELKSHLCIPVQQVANARFPCKTCKKVFTHSSSLYNHNRNIHKLKGAKTLCSVCGNYVSNIYNHMMRHTGEKPFQCNQCEKRFIAKPQLRQHLLVHSGLKPYVCSVCAKAFNNLYNLQVHERIHKGDRCHICNICNKGFLEKSYLKKHMSVHSKI